MVIVIDPQIAGISGDMMLCALVNLGANKSKIIEGVRIAEKNLDGSIIKNIDFSKVNKLGIEATELILDFKEENQERKGIEIQKCIEKSSVDVGLSDLAKQFAISSIETLIKAESKIHGGTLSLVHLHEVSSIDTVVDILGTAIALDDLKILNDEIISTPVAVGGGSLTFSHGTTSNPTNAILEILKNSGITISGGQIKDELTTPTGASLLVNLTKTCFDYYPKMKIDSIGYGAGTKNFDGFSNVLRVVKGEKTKNYDHDVVQILETNVDDVSGEVLGHMIDKIMENGAKDVTITQGISKKGRPTNLISVICDLKSMNTLLELLISETGTLGVRRRSSERYVVPRTILTVPIKLNEKIFKIRCKITRENNIINNFKIESDDIKKISDSINQSFKKTEELIRLAVNEKIDL
ncbi:MAG: nickel pincer cofactor biosynthesis protein LarC [Nitrosopumilaceae archaeon]